MTLTGILSSPSQRRSFFLTSIMALMLSALVSVGIAYIAPSTRVWTALGSISVSIFSSGVFALMSGLYIHYFFVDPTDPTTKSVVLPQDIGQTLQDIASTATTYKIFARTGRHFRAVILPLLVNRARESRRPIQIEVVLLDFRNAKLCEKYASYRSISSFDKQVWNTRYVEKEIVATIMACAHSASENSALIGITLFLSSRLSTFRIEGSSERILITREDPKDDATLYLGKHRDFSAYLTELGWIKDEAFEVQLSKMVGAPMSLTAMFGEIPEMEELEVAAQSALTSKSPYAR